MAHEQQLLLFLNLAEGLLRSQEFFASGGNFCCFLRGKSYDASGNSAAAVSDQNKFCESQDK